MSESSENKEPSQNELEKQRLKKLESVKEKGIDPYPNRFNRADTVLQIRSKFFAHETEVPEGMISTAGRVVAKRDMGKAAFVQFQDESGQLQIYANNKTLNENDYFVLQNLDLGDIIGVKGKPFRTKTNEPSIHAEELVLLAKNLSPLPVVKEKDGEVFDAFADVETRYRKRYADLAVNKKTRADFLTRSRIVSEIRAFLTQRGFIEVETPMLQAIASGAAARPFKTHHNTLNIELFMRIAPELYLKRLIVGGFEKVFELNRNFRNEGISTKHNPEFTMIELYEAYGDFNSMMQLTEELFEHIALKIHGKTEIPYGEHMISLKKPWRRVAYLDIIQEKTGIDFKPFLSEAEPSFAQGKELAIKAGIDVKGLHTFWEVVDAAFSQKAEPELIQPVFITDYPKAISPLAKNIPGNPHLVERFEPYITGREMGNVFTELNDPQEQYARFADQVKQHEQGAEETIAMDEDFIEALRVGMPPTGGLGIGIDRLVMLFTNNASIKDVILFPLLRPTGQ